MPVRVIGVMGKAAPFILAPLIPDCCATCLSGLSCSLFFNGLISLPLHRAELSVFISGPRCSGEGLRECEKGKCRILSCGVRCHTARMACPVNCGAPFLRVYLCVRGLHGQKTESHPSFAV